jgi:hypothetical protein
MPRQAASIVRGSVLRSRVFSLAKTCSIGLRSASSAAGRTAWRRRGGSGGARSWLARDRPGWTVATIVSSVSMPAACRFVRSRGISWSFMALRFRHRSILSRVGASDKPGAVDHSIYKGHLKTLDDEDLRRLEACVAELAGEPKYRKMAALAELWPLFLVRSPLSELWRKTTPQPSVANDRPALRRYGTSLRASTSLTGRLPPRQHESNRSR